MIIVIIPHRGTDAIRFGMTRSEVEQAVGRTPKRGRRGKEDYSDYDFFEKNDFFVYYDVKDRVNAIEFFSKGADVFYDGMSLFSKPAGEIREWARQRDPNLDTSDGFLSRSMGLGMYAPFIDITDPDEEDLHAPAQSFIVFRPGYYEEERERIAAVFPGLGWMDKAKG